MKLQEIKKGNNYRLKHAITPTGEYYGWAKVLEVYRGVGANETVGDSKSWVKCEHIVNDADEEGYIRYFRPADLVAVK